VKALVAAAAVLLSSGCSTALTSERLSPSFDEVFARMLLQQQALVGRTDLSRATLQVLTSCSRTGTASDGPGEDWLCSVQYVDGGTSAAQVFEVQLKADGCWRASGPPATQPATLVENRTGQRRTNPLAEFDGCLDPSWSGG
jgi:hypothetical protein